MAAVLLRGWGSRGMDSPPWPEVFEYQKHIWLPILYCFWTLSVSSDFCGSTGYKWNER